MPDSPSIPFAIVCDIDGVLMTGDWKVIGKVSAIDHERGVILFNTEAMLVEGKVRDESKMGRLAYRLPHQLPMPLNAGDPITILHDHETDKKRLEWDIHISSGDRLVLATSHQHDDSPPQSAKRREVLFAQAPGGHSVFYWSDPANKELNQSKHDVVESTITLQTRSTGGDRTIDVGKGDLAEIDLDGRHYAFVVLASELYTTGDESDHESLDDDELKTMRSAADHPETGDDGRQSHSLECMLIGIDF
ncbi:MAG: hypothetical protein HKN47_19405 [Pirellulaceae bacterium]|nr:hypothetical protein [Pirellulaceae bacterium]